MQISCLRNYYIYIHYMYNMSGAKTGVKIVTQLLEYFFVDLYSYINLAMLNICSQTGRLTIWSKDFAVQFVLLVVLLLALLGTTGDAHFRKELCVALFHPLLSQLLLLLVNVTHAARDHGIDHRCLLREDLKSLGYLFFAASFLDDGVKLHPQAALKDVSLFCSFLKVPGQLVIGQVDQNVLKLAKRQSKRYRLQDDHMYMYMY